MKYYIFYRHVNAFGVEFRSCDINDSVLSLASEKKLFIEEVEK